MMRSAAITGIGCVTGFGVGVEQTWRALLEGRSATHERAFDASAQTLQTSGRTRVTTQAPTLSELQGLVPVAGFIRPPRTTLLARLAAQEALEMANFADDVDRTRIGLMINRHFGQHSTSEEYQQTLWDKGPGAVSGLQFVQSISNAVLGRLALDLQLRGPSILSFGPLLMEHALDVLRDEQADAVLVGGVDEATDLVFLLCDGCGLTPASRNQPEEMRPYDSRWSGLIPGDGSVFILLERPAHAAARGAKPLGYLRGCASLTDGAGLSDPSKRDLDALTSCIQRALSDAETSASDIKFASGGAAGLRGFDEVEAQAVATSFSDGLPLTSTKGSLGETWGASGGLSLLSALLALREGRLPPTAGAEEQDANCPAFIVRGSAAEVEGPAALALSLDMTGQDCAYVLASEA